MLKRIHLKNFKSARDISIPLAPLTVLSGLNGSGKSTVLQAIALVKQSLNQSSTFQTLLLRGDLVKLGRSEDIRFENAANDEISICLDTSAGSVTLLVLATPSEDVLPIEVIGEISCIELALGKGFQYIQADRLTPANQYEQTSSPERKSGWLGSGGEFTVDYLIRNESKKVPQGRLFTDVQTGIGSDLLRQVAPTEGLLDQTTAWMQLLSPGVRPRVSALNLADTAALRYTYTGTSVDSASRQHRPANVGFGLTYCLPIVVACLSAPKNAVLLLENPEAHLHPRGQAALGHLMARCASDGVQIIVETHSDHVLNGIRIAAKKSVIAHTDVAAHFFTRDLESGETSVTSPTLLAKGRFSDWPEGFFDEWSKALDELLDL